MSLRIVIDTNVYVSRLLLPNSTPGKAVVRAWMETTLVSVETWTELRIVLRRAKLAKYIRADLTGPYLNHVWAVAEQVEIPSPIRACRDPRDDKFLEVAVHGRADLIVTGDADLLALHPFHGVGILTPAAYLDQK